MLCREYLRLLNTFLCVGEDLVSLRRPNHPCKTHDVRLTYGGPEGAQSHE